MVINKIDRPHARPAEVLDEILELFIELDASDQQLDFPVVYTDGGKEPHPWIRKPVVKQNGEARCQLNGQAQDKSKHQARSEASGANLKPLFDLIIENILAPKGDPKAPAAGGFCRSTTIPTWDGRRRAHPAGMYPQQAGCCSPGSRRTDAALTPVKPLCL